VLQKEYITIKQD